MKRPIFIALLAASIAAPVNAALVAKKDGVEIRLTQRPCPQSVLRHQPEGSRGYFRLAETKIDGVEYEACWAPMGDKIFLRYEDGDFGMPPLSMFQEDEI